MPSHAVVSGVTLPCSSATGDQAGAGRVAITQLAGSEDCSTIGVGEHRPCVAGRPYNRQGTLSCRTAGAGDYVERDRILLRNGRSVASNGRPVPPRNLICVVDSWVDAWSVFLPTSIWPGKVGFAQSRRDLLSGFNAPANFYVTGRQRLAFRKWDQHAARGRVTKRDLNNTTARGKRLRLCFGVDYCCGDVLAYASACSASTSTLSGCHGFGT